MQRNAPNPGSYVFVSYLREDSEAVGRLCTELRSHGVDVWLDKDDIVPGSRWKQSIRMAIRQGSFFIACFSEAYDRRGRSYMNEELVEAIEVLRQQPEDRSWFIPVKLSACKIPNRSIGAGQTLDDLDYVDLHADWTAGVIRLLSVIQPHKKKLSEALSIIIPMFNEEGVIGPTLMELVKKRFHDRYSIIVCDDDSTDRSMDEARVIATPYKSIRVIRNTPNGCKVGAIKAALRQVDTPYVLMIDADSMVNETAEGSLDGLVNRMRDRDLTAMAFKIRPPATNLLERLQQLEYLLFTDSVRRILGVAGCLVGQGALWKVEDLKMVLRRHTGIFEGDDLESTILATMLMPQNDRVVFETRKVIVTTRLKKTIRELVRQRSYIWDIGLLHALIDTPGILTQRGRHGAFFRSVFITEVLAHPFRLLGAFDLFIMFLYRLAWNFPPEPYSSFLYDFQGKILDIILWTRMAYVALWALNVLSVVYAEWPSVRRIASWIAYLTPYMAAATIYTCAWWFFFVGIDKSIVTMPPYTWWGRSIGMLYLWWYAFCAVLILVSSEPWRQKPRLLVRGLLMPFYYAFLLLIPRTIGYSAYIWGRLRGRYVPHNQRGRKPRTAAY